jgi:hypothetical protein
MVFLSEYLVVPSVQDMNLVEAPFVVDTIVDKMAIMYTRLLLLLLTTMCE